MMRADCGLMWRKSCFSEGASQFHAGSARAYDDERQPGADFFGRGGALSAFEGVEDFVADGGGFFDRF
jgi:hypothetical protein